jgi:hypothetical protein
VFTGAARLTNRSPGRVQIANNVAD